MLKKEDLILLSYFRENARSPLTRLSKLTRIPVSTIYDKLKSYEKKLIEKHTTLVDFRQLGYLLHVNFLFKVEKNDKEHLIAELRKDPSINTICKIGNGFDLFVEGFFKDVTDLNSFSERLEKYSFTDKKDYVVLEDIRREGFLTNHY